MHFVYNKIIQKIENKTYGIKPKQAKEGFLGQKIKVK